MGKEIIPKERYTLFDFMDKMFEENQRKMQQIREQMDKSIFNLYNFGRQPVIKMGTIEEFQKSIEEFKKENPNANITARAYTFSSENPEQNKVFEYKEQEKLPEKKKKSKKAKK